MEPSVSAEVPPPPKPEPDRPATFNLPGYEFIEKVGEGGTSTVWKARQVSLDRIVAIKTLDPALVPDQDTLARFRQEAQAAARLKHPSIVQVYDAGEYEGRPYLVMEFVDGCTVGDLLRRAGRLTERNALLITDAVSQALAYAWDKDCIIHLDVKPDNVLVEHDGTIKVADLGLARFIGMHQRRVDSDTILGTPNYVSPEQAEGVPDLDCRTDIYSLGAMLYHMVTGRMPFAGHPGSGAMEAHVGEYLTDPMELCADLSPGIIWLIEKLMIKNRAYRPAYWSLVLADLNEVKEGRFPRPPLPEAGQSTVMRCPARPAATSPAAATSPGARMRVAAPPAPKRRLVVSGKTLAQTSAKHVYEERGIGSALTQLLWLVGVALAVGVFFGMGIPQRIGRRPPAAAAELTPPPSVAPAEPVVRTVRVARASAALAAAKETEPVEEIDWSVEGVDPAPKKSGKKDGVVTWDNPDFLEGARLFNDSYERYMEFQKTRANRRDLPLIEQQVRDAIKKFESAKPQAPRDVDIANYIQQCYHMISDVRQSTLLLNEEGPSRPVRQALPAPHSSLE